MRLSLLDRVVPAASEEHGAVIVFFAVFLPVAILFATFVIDVGNWFGHQRHLQLQADAGVFAAAQGVCNSESVVAAARQYSGIAGSPVYNVQIGGTSGERIHEELNRKTYFGQSSPVDSTVREGNPCEVNMVDLKITETELPWFFKVANVSFINAHARIEFLKASQDSGVIPIAISEAGLVEAKEGASNPLQTITINNAVSNCTPGANYKQKLGKGCTGAYAVNPGTTCATSPAATCVNFEAGTKANDIAAGFDERLEPTGSCTNTNHWSLFPNLPKGDPRIVTVIIIASAGSEPIKGFGTFYVTGWGSQGTGFTDPCNGHGDDPAAEQTMVGYFIKYLNTTGPGGGTEPCKSIETCEPVLTQ